MSDSAAKVSIRPADLDRHPAKYQRIGLCLPVDTTLVGPPTSSPARIPGATFLRSVNVTHSNLQGDQSGGGRERGGAIVSAPGEEGRRRARGEQVLGGPEGPADLGPGEAGVFQEGGYEAMYMYMV